MVYIKKIMIKNFKSFGNLVKLNFEPGFNIVTGPNGSGKSNIIDAVQFVLGELHTRRMRVSDHSGLIYDGNEEGGSQKASVAQVTLTFENTDRNLAIDKNLVSISRKVDRQGNSQYYLNGKRVSRRAILDMLEMAGISPGGYNIVLQGTATRLSDLTPQERMKAFEDLIGITEYDEKKAEAKEKLSEAERKIEIASARIDEVRKRVSELEAQRNDAIKFQLLQNQENNLNAIKTSYKLNQLQIEAEKIGAQIENTKREIEALEKEKSQLIKERDSAKASFEEFNKENSEKGNTRLPLLKSDLVAKKTLKNSLTSSINSLERQKKVLEEDEKNKLKDIDNLKNDLIVKEQEIKIKSDKLNILENEISEKEIFLKELNEKLNTIKETSKSNLKKIEQLTEILSSHQEMINGYEIEINGKKIKYNAIKEKLEENDRKKEEILKVINTLKTNIEKYNELKEEEAKKLEDLLNTIESQITHQRNLRNTIQNASKLAKDAEIIVTQFSAKRDLWEKLAADEKAYERVKEMGEAGALKGYYGALRSLIKVDLKYQRAVIASSKGWSSAFIFDEIQDILECIEHLKKNRLGSTKFIPLKNIQETDQGHEVSGEGIVGLIPNLIRYDDKFKPVINFVWGNTVIVQDTSAALEAVKKGYIAVTLSGDVYELKGGIIGGFYQPPPDASKLIPKKESIDNLSSYLKSLRDRLIKRMSDLKHSGEGLRKFTKFMESSQKMIENIDKQIEETKENISRLEKNIIAIEDKNKEIKSELEQEQNLIATLEERRSKTLQEIEKIKTEISEVRELAKPSNTVDLEIRINALNAEISSLQNERNQLRSDVSILTSLVNDLIRRRISESETQVEKWREKIREVEEERKEAEANLSNLADEIKNLEKEFEKVASEVEASTQVIVQHQKTLKLFEQRIDHLDQKREALSKKHMDLSFEYEKLKLQINQVKNDLFALGFNEKIDTSNINLDLVEITLSSIKAEKSSLGAINQLAESQYAEIVGNFKQMSVRLNELEEEKNSILKFIEEVEKEKQEHFMKAFNEVCENFSTIFAKLTGGGEGRLELQKPENPFSGGVDLYVQFPGKPMRLVAGASGGERSVAAIAYLLSIQKFLKAPFYLFDEIDAHLDDLNVLKLAETLKENSDGAQFIVVTLKDAMVQNAERIYGVFNQGGSSRVIALPLKLEVVS
ncbi:chromosome segregation protein SMC [Candidatus Bathyarchaeota archaeon]|nr:chromosome segregation protein SMC [Candidatus Bathyarchaeota archaeon]